MSKYEGHTPGPWQTDDFAHLVGGADGKVVCSVRRARDQALIAAAPELLAALLVAREYVATSDSPYAENDMATIDAAIAKTKPPPTAK